MVRTRLAISVVLVSTLLLLNVKAKSVDPYKVRFVIHLVFFPFTSLLIGAGNNDYFWLSPFSLKFGLTNLWVL